MKLIRVGAAALNQLPLAWKANRERLAEAMRQARAAGVSVLCLPEMAVTGYGCEDAFYSPSVSQTAWEVVESLAGESQGLICNLGLPVRVHGVVYNANAVLVDGEIAGVVAKKHLAGDGVHYEPRWFRPWPVGACRDLEVNGRLLPMGDRFFDLGGVRIGFEICEEAWVARRPGADLAARGVDIVLNPSASHFAFGKREVRERFVIEGSRAFGVTYIYANLVGLEAGRIVYDGGNMIASTGTLLAQGPSLGFADVGLTTAVIDVDATRVQRARTASFAVSPDGEADSGVVHRPFAWPRLSPEAATQVFRGWESGPHAREEGFTRAVSLALFDYLRKSRSLGFVVSLSGGADSAAVSCLCVLGLRFALAELGVAGVKRKLGFIPAVASSDDPAVWARAILTTVYQGTANSSQTTRGAAAEVARAVGSRHLEWEVEELVSAYIKLAGGTLERPLDWAKDDIALQNIQARARAPGVWMLANLEGKLLLATSNRSEAAVGYATMDGDTCGGLSPIAGIDKAWLRQWLRWLGEQGPEGLGAMGGLSTVNGLPPTAELRPPGEHQTDEADLMPYPVLDAIERAAIRDKLDPVEVWGLMRVRFPQVSGAEMGRYVERFFRLWCRNQWKRERYAPSFHVDDESLDPKSWCRFPILSGGFERELAELKAVLAREEAR